MKSLVVSDGVIQHACLFHGPRGSTPPSWNDVRSAIRQIVEGAPGDAPYRVQRPFHGRGLLAGMDRIHRLPPGSTRGLVAFAPSRRQVGYRGFGVKLRVERDIVRAVGIIVVTPSDPEALDPFRFSYQLVDGVARWRWSFHRHARIWDITASGRDRGPWTAECGVRGAAISARSGPMDDLTTAFAEMVPRLPGSDAFAAVGLHPDSRLPG